MITLPLLTEKDLEIFRGKRVVVYGHLRKATQVCDILQAHNIAVFAICTGGYRPQRTTYRGTPLVTWPQLQRYAKKYDDIIVQGVAYAEEVIQKSNNRLHCIGLMTSSLEAGQIIMSNANFIISMRLEDPQSYAQEFSSWFNKCTASGAGRINGFLKRAPSNPILLCLPPKTADHTLINTFYTTNQVYAHQDNGQNKLYNRLYTLCHQLFHDGFFQKASLRLIRPLDKTGLAINFINTSHKARSINTATCNQLGKTVKIITAVREPISQQISRLYQDISQGGELMNWILGDCEYASLEERVKFIDSYAQLFSSDNIDIQTLWDSWLERYVYYRQTVEKKAYIPQSVQQFVADFKTHVLDLLAHPFDQEAGYTIIKEGNIEVFVYQLEKLNNIVPQLSEWVGVPFDKLEKGNVGEDKWIGESYKQAQKEIQITQEYFDRCYNEPYVKHFYSEADIEKFKARWRGHIK